MSEFFTGKSVIKDATTGEIKAYELPKDSYDYLKHEAERVVELEKRAEELEEWREQYHERNMVLLQENQRYKQALEGIRKITVQDYFKTDIYVIASEALEGK